MENVWTDIPEAVQAQTEAVSAIEETMSKYNQHRALWIAEFGNDAGFDEWFTQQVLRK